MHKKQSWESCNVYLLSTNTTALHSSLLCHQTSAITFELWEKTDECLVVSKKSCQSWECRVKIIMVLQGWVIKAVTANAVCQSLKKQIQNMRMKKLKKKALNSLLKLNQIKQTKAAQTEFERLC